MLRSQGYRVVRTPYLTLKFRHNGTSRARIGVLAGKQVHKNAATRNFYKRQARDVFAAGLPKGYDFLIVLSPAVNDLTKKEIREEFKKICSTFTG